MSLATSEGIKSYRKAIEHERRTTPHAKSATFYGDSLSITFLTGAKLHIPISIIPELKDLDTKMLIAVSPTGDGKGIRWPLAGIELSLKAILERFTVLEPSTPV